MSAIAKARIVVGTDMLAAWASGCAGQGAISPDTTCAEYLQRPSNERHDAAVRISAETAGVSGPGNRMWGLSLDAAWGSSPSMTVGEHLCRDG